MKLSEITKETLTDDDIKEYIQYLLTTNSNKRLDRSEFPSDNINLKIDKSDYYQINNRESGFKIK